MDNRSVYNIGYVGKDMDYRLTKSKFTSGYLINFISSTWKELMDAVKSKVKISIDSNSEILSILSYSLQNNKLYVTFFYRDEVISVILEEDTDGKIKITNQDPKNYFTITAKEDMVSILPTRFHGADFEYSLDGIFWSKLDSEVILSKRSDSVQIRGNNKQVSGNIIKLYSNKLIKISGNIMSLLYENDFEDKTDLKRVTFTGLMENCSGLINAKDLILPSTKLTFECYYQMFQGCTSLVKAPKLPATTLATYCYGYMFSGCTSLTEAPELPTTTLANFCYSNMFSGCTSLETAPKLPATILTRNCYSGMFENCSSIEKISISATTLYEGCYSYFLTGCTGLKDVYIKGSVSDDLVNSIPTSTGINLHVVNDNAFGSNIYIPSNFSNCVDSVYIYSGTKWAIDDSKAQNDLFDRFVGKDLYIDGIYEGVIQHGGGGYYYY